MMPNNAHILVIDDNRSTVLLVERILRKRGYQVDVAYDGEAGLALARQRPPDLIILDIVMPGIDGYEVCAQLQRERKTAVIPVLMLTAKGNLEELSVADGRVSRRVHDRMRGFNAGATEFLSKPIKAQLLIERIQSLLWMTGANTQR